MEPAAMTGCRRCAWAQGDRLMEAYHDTEWGVPVRDSRSLWGMLVLESFQAGLSWRTILYRRDGFRRAFEDLDPDRVASFDEARVATLLADPGIIRSRAKIAATIGNARAYLAIENGGTSFSRYAWELAGGAPVLGDGLVAPATTARAEAASASLRSHGFRFVGAVTVYAWMQAVGMVNDHAAGCFRRAEIAGAEGGP